MFAFSFSKTHIQDQSFISRFPELVNCQFIIYIKCYFDLTNIVSEHPNLFHTAGTPCAGKMFLVENNTIDTGEVDVGRRAMQDVPPG